VNTIMVCRITLNLRTTVYGPTQFERTHNSIPMSDLRDPRPERSDQTLDPVATKNLQVHSRKDLDQSRNFNYVVEFTDEVSPATHQMVGQEVLVIGGHV